MKMKNEIKQEKTLKILEEALLDAKSNMRSLYGKDKKRMQDFIKWCEKRIENILI